MRIRPSGAMCFTNGRCYTAGRDAVADDGTRGGRSRRYGRMAEGDMSDGPEGPSVTDAVPSRNLTAPSRARTRCCRRPTGQSRSEGGGGRGSRPPVIK